MKYIICHAEKKIKFMNLFDSIEDVIDFLHTQYKCTAFKCFPKYRTTLNWYKNKVYFISMIYNHNDMIITDNNLIVYGIPILKI